jgi:hypothetical protein
MPHAVSRSSELQSKARKWIRRELQVFHFLEPFSRGRADGRKKQYNAEFLVEYITAILRNVDLRDSSGKAQELLQEYLGPGNARLFLHELESWMRSPCLDLQDWDRTVQYKECVPTHSKRNYAPG